AFGPSEHGAATLLGLVGLGVCAIVERKPAEGIEHLSEAAVIVERSHGTAMATELDAGTASGIRTLIARLNSPEATPAVGSEATPLDHDLLTVLTTLPGLTTVADIYASRGYTEAGRHAAADWVYYDHRLFWPVYNLLTEL